MVRDEATPSSSSGLYGGGGAGGKFRKPSSRRPPATPYDRPPPNQSRTGGWISKIVGGATRILPSFFSKSAPSAAQNLEYNNDPEEEGDTDEEETCCPSNVGESESALGINPTEKVETLNNSSNADQLGGDKRNGLPSGDELSKIEQLVMERQFSRHDVDRLLELLHSNAAEASNVEQVGKKPNNFIQREGEEFVLAHETPSFLFKEKQESLNVAGLGTPLPFFQSNVEEEVGASPIDIARAYMGNRVSDLTTDYKGTKSKYGGDLIRSNKKLSQSLISSPSNRTSVCWPGAMAEERFGHSTPQSVSSRYGLHQFQRSPYARSIYSKSKSKLARPEADSSRFQNFPSSTRVQPQTPIFGQRERVQNDVSGSAGPVRLRRKFLSEASPRRAVAYHSSPKGHLPTTITNNFLHTTKKLDSTASKATLNNSEAGVADFQTSNSTLKAIMEHLDRHPPTPNERSAELQIATSSNKYSFSKLTDKMLKEGNNKGKLSLEERPKERSEATDMAKATKTIPMANGNYDYERKSSNETFSFGSSNIRVKTTDKQPTSRSQDEGQSFTNTPLNSTIPESQKRPPHHPSGPKPNLAFISVDKPKLGQSFFSPNNNSGFTFPISSRSGALPEPPTPSIMPSNIASSPPKQNNDGQEIPKFKFGEKRTTPVLNFSFPSTSNASAQDEVSDLKFTFGEGKKNRLSFKSVGKVA